MPELTPELIALGARGFSGDIPIGADGTPIDQPPVQVSDGGAGILAQIAATQGLVAGEAPGGGPAASPDPIGYGYAPYYNASPQDFPENRTPLAPANFGLPDDWDFRSGEPGSWEQAHTPNDRSTGGGFFTANDLFPDGVPMGFQQGATRPSTNNYRLLPQDYRSPRYIMRNGYIIDLRATDLRGPGYVAPDGGSSRGANWQQDPTAGFPADYSYTQGLSFYGWPGASNWASGGIGGDTW